MKLISEEGKEKIRQIYRDVCIAENAFQNDVGGYNGNFEQRRIMGRKIFDVLGMIGDDWEIEDEVKLQTWTRSYDDQMRIKYIRMEQEL